MESPNGAGDAVASPARASLTLPRTATRHDMMDRVRADQPPVPDGAGPGHTRALNDLLKAGLLETEIVYRVTDAGTRQAKVWDAARDHERWAEQVLASQQELEPQQGDVSHALWGWDGWSDHWDLHAHGSAEELAHGLERMERNGDTALANFTAVEIRPSADGPPTEFPRAVTDSPAAEEPAPAEVPELEPVAEQPARPARRRPRAAAQG